MRGRLTGAILGAMDALLSRRTALLFALVGFAAGCAALLPRVEAPRITVADVTLKSVSLFEQKYTLSLRVQNPNAFSLPLGGLAYELRVNDRFFASGVSNRAMNVPGYGTEVLDVDAYSSIGDVLRQLLELGKGVPQRLRYRLKGHVRLTSPALEIPFDESGQVALLPERQPTGR